MKEAYSSITVPNKKRRPFLNASDCSCSYLFPYPTPGLPQKRISPSTSLCISQHRVCDARTSGYFLKLGIGIVANDPVLEIPRDEMT